MEIRDATHLWGSETGVAQEIIRKELGDNLIRMALIGQAGENLVRYACTVRCKRKVGFKGRYEVSPEYGGPEYETIASLGSCLEIDDLEAIAKGTELCNRYTLDTISTGMSIAFAMECFEI